MPVVREGVNEGLMKAPHSEEKSPKGELAVCSPKEGGLIIGGSFFFVHVCVLGCVASFQLYRSEP